MKALVLTRKIKDELAEHFKKGGTVHNVTGELSRVSMPDRESCHRFHLQKMQRHREAIQRNGLGAMP